MKIAFTPEYPHVLTGNSGGIGTSIKNPAAGLVAAGCVRCVLGKIKMLFLWMENVEIQRIKTSKSKALSVLLKT
jgi:hypothetical protein